MVREPPAKRCTSVRARPRSRCHPLWGYRGCGPAARPSLIRTVGPDRHRDPRPGRRIVLADVAAWCYRPTCITRCEAGRLLRFAFEQTPPGDLVHGGCYNFRCWRPLRRFGVLPLLMGWFQVRVLMRALVRIAQSAEHHRFAGPPCSRAPAIWTTAPPDARKGPLFYG